MEFKTLSSKSAVALAFVAFFAFHIGWKVEGLAAGFAMIAYLVVMTVLCWSQTPRLAFGLGLIIGITTFIPQTMFFWGTVGTKVVPLWILLSLCPALFLWLGRTSVGRWPKLGILAIPILWVGLEFLRSQFVSPWLTPGLALPTSPWLYSWGLAVFGSFGFSFLVIGSTGLWWGARRGGDYRTVTPSVVWMLGIVFWLGIILKPIDWTPTPQGPDVAGVQFEGGFDGKKLDFLPESQVLEALDRTIGEHPDAKLIVLPEYARPRAPEGSILAWCRQNQKYLVVGGRQWVSETEFYNSAYVVDPQGQIVFWQAKCRPVPIVPDGLAAEAQDVWQSPWGPLGIAICYDLAYSSVIDELVRQGARGLIVISMDLQEWGSQEHRIAARIAQVRAAEHGMSIFRVSSFAGSALVGRNGIVLAQTASGQFQTVGGTLSLTDGRIPLDRHVLWPSAGLTLILLTWFLGATLAAYGRAFVRSRRSRRRRTRRRERVVVRMVTLR